MKCWEYPSGAFPKVWYL